MFGSFYVSLSDDDSNDIEKMRVRVKRNWRKFAPRGRDNEIFRRIFWRSRQWWPILLCVPVFALLLFEASRVRTKPTEDAKLNFVEKELKGNLNRMDMPMKSVNGTKKPCLKILPLEEIQHLAFPLSALSNLHVKRVIYQSVTDTHLTRGDATVPQQLIKATGFNLFTRDQALQAREEIFKMLSQQLFPQARYSIWVDSKSQIRRDSLGVFEALLWHTNSALAISEHGARSSIYDEGNAVIRKHKATPEEVEMQLT